MMKIKWVIVAVFSLLISGEQNAQVDPKQGGDFVVKPPPTVAQCRADRDAWSEASLGDDGKSLFSAADLTAMAMEMSVCNWSIDNPNFPSAPNKNSTYQERFMTIYKRIEGRYANFLLRHPELMKRFNDEDEAGAR